MKMIKKKISRFLFGWWRYNVALEKRERILLDRHMIRVAQETLERRKELVQIEEEYNTLFTQCREQQEMNKQLALGKIIALHVVAELKKIRRGEVMSHFEVGEKVFFYLNSAAFSPIQELLIGNMDESEIKFFEFIFLAEKPYLQSACVRLKGVIVNISEESRYSLPALKTCYRYKKYAIEEPITKFTFNVDEYQIRKIKKKVINEQF